MGSGAAGRRGANGSWLESHRAVKTWRVGPTGAIRYGRGRPPHRGTESGYERRAGSQTHSVARRPGRRLPQGAVDTDGRRRTGVADRLRQRGQPVTGSRFGEDQRGRDTHGAWCGALARLSAIADRKPRAGRDGRRAWITAGLLGTGPAAGGDPYRSAVLDEIRPGRPRARLHRRRDAVDRIGLRRGAGAAGFKGRSERSAQGRRTQFFGRGTSSNAAFAGGRRSGAIARPADRRGIDDAQFYALATYRLRVQPGKLIDAEPECAGGEIRRDGEILCLL